MRSKKILQRILVGCFVLACVCAFAQEKKAADHSGSPRTRASVPTEQFRVVWKNRVTGAINHTSWSPDVRAVVEDMVAREWGSSFHDAFPNLPPCANCKYWVERRDAKGKIRKLK